MFNFIRKNAVRRRDLFNRDSTRSLCFVEYPSLIRYISGNTTEKNSFTVSYLMDSCGLSREKAISLSDKVQFENSTKPDSVLTLFKNHGLTNTHISKIVERHPELLLSSVDKTLQPKFEFFHSVGLSGSLLFLALSRDPILLRASLEKAIIPAFDMLKSVLQTEAKVFAMLKRSARVLTEDPQKQLVPNIALLRAAGVPDYNIQSFLVIQPRSMLRTHYRFKEIVEEVKKMNIHPSKTMFITAIHGLCSMSKSTLEAKFDLYRKWGWSEEEIQCAFRKQPFCMMLSEKNIMKTMDYLVNKMGYDPSLIAKQPGVLLYSLEKRIIPRCSVLQVLIANGMVKKDYKISTWVYDGEQGFLKKFVVKFEEKVPELWNAYRGKGR